MSLPWFRVDNDLCDHPKIDALAELLGDPNAGWYVIRLWSWTARYAARGRLADGARTALERVCCWRGQPGALVSALVEVGLVDRIDADADGCTMEVHDWWEKQGALVEKAEKDRERKKALRTGARTSNGTARGRPTERRADGARKSTERRDEGSGDETRRDETIKEEAHPLQAVWNETAAAGGCPKWTETPKHRRKAADAALARRPIEQWRAVFVAMAADPFATGKDPASGGWRADVDYALRPGGTKPEPALKYLERTAAPQPAAKPDNSWSKLRDLG